MLLWLPGGFQVRLQFTGPAHGSERQQRAKHFRGQLHYGFFRRPAFKLVMQKHFYSRKKNKPGPSLNSTPALIVHGGVYG
jgi:hypothetical protein